MCGLARVWSRRRPEKWQTGEGTTNHLERDWVILRGLFRPLEGKLVDPIDALNQETHSFSTSTSSSGHHLFFPFFPLTFVPLEGCHCVELPPPPFQHHSGQPSASHSKKTKKRSSSSSTSPQGWQSRTLPAAPDGWTTRSTPLDSRPARALPRPAMRAR